MSLALPYPPHLRRRFVLGLFLSVVLLNLAALIVTSMAVRESLATETATDSTEAEIEELRELGKMGRPGSVWEFATEYQVLEIENRDRSADQRGIHLQNLQSQYLNAGLILKIIGVGCLFFLVGLLCLGAMIYGLVRLVRGPTLQRRWENWQQGVVSPLPIWTLLVGIVLTFGALVVAHSLPQAQMVFAGLAIWEAAQALLLAGLLVVGRAQNSLRPVVDFGFTRRPARAAFDGLKYYFAWLPSIWLLALAGKLVYSIISAAAGYPAEAEGGPIEEIIAPEYGIWGPLALLILAVGLAPLFEELFFRGFLYGALRRWLSAPGAMVVSAALFAVVHPVPNHVPIFFLGLLLAYIYEKTGNLLAAMVVHFTHNLITTLLMGLMFL